jgi:hypothetical protein
MDDQREHEQQKGNVMQQAENRSDTRSQNQADEFCEPIQEYMRQDAEQYPPPATPLRQAQVIAQQLFPMLMSVAVDLPELEPEGVFRYLAWLIKESGNPRDPLVQMLLCQTALAHFRVVAIHAKAARCDDKDAFEAYSNAAIRLTAELRRLMLTVAEYRDRSRTITTAGNNGASIGYPVGTSSATSASAAEVAKIETRMEVKGEKQRDTKQRSNGRHRASCAPASQPSTGGRGEAQSHQAWTNHGGGTRMPAPVSTAESTMGKVHRSENGRGKGKVIKKQRQATKGRQVRQAAAIGVG